MRLEGPVLRPSGEVSLTADSVRLSGRDAGAVVARAHAAQGQIEVDLGAPRFGAEASGSVTLQSPRPWTAQVTLNNADVVQALTLLGVNPETVAGSTAALSASGRASGNLDTPSLSNMTMEVRALDGQMRGQPLSLVQPARLSLEGSRLSLLEPVQIRLGELSVRAAGSWGVAREAPAEGIAVSLDGRVEDVLKYLPPASRDRFSGEGPLRVDLSIRGGADLASISGDAFAQLTNLEQKAPERAGSRPTRARTLSGEVRLALDLRATAFDLDAVDGTIVATTLTISAGQVPIAQQAPTRLRLEKGQIHIEQFDWKLPSGALAASGTIGLEPPERQRDACQRHDVSRARGRLSASGRRRPGGIRHPDCRSDRQPAVRGDDRSHGRTPHPAGGTNVTRGMDRSARGHRRDHRSRQRFAARSMVATSRSTGRSLDAEPRRHHR